MSKQYKKYQGSGEISSIIEMASSKNAIIVCRSDYHANIVRETMRSKKTKVKDVITLEYFLRATLRKGSKIVLEGVKYSEVRNNMSRYTLVGASSVSFGDVEPQLDNTVTTKDEITQADVYGSILGLIVGVVLTATCFLALKERWQVLIVALLIFPLMTLTRKAVKTYIASNGGNNNG